MLFLLHKTTGGRQFAPVPLVLKQRLVKTLQSVKARRCSHPPTDRPMRTIILLLKSYHFQRRFQISLPAGKNRAAIGPPYRTANSSSLFSVVRRPLLNIAQLTKIN